MKTKKMIATLVVALLSVTAVMAKTSVLSFSKWHRWNVPTANER